MIPFQVDSPSTPRGVTQPYPVITGLDEFTMGLTTSDFENDEEVILTEMPVATDFRPSVEVKGFSRAAVKERGRSFHQSGDPKNRFYRVQLGQDYWPKPGSQNQLPQTCSRGR